MAKAKAKPKAPKGRPTKYSPAILKATNDYVDACVDKVKLFHKTQGMNSDTYERIVFANLPMKEELAFKLGVHRDTLTEWAKQHPDFSVALERLEQKQKIMLIRGGISGQYNPLITKLTLSANHGMKEKTDVTTDDKPLPQPIINVPRNDIDTKD